MHTTGDLATAEDSTMCRQELSTAGTSVFVHLVAQSVDLHTLAFLPTFVYPLT
jgi:hypothetical protein